MDEVWQTLFGLEGFDVVGAEVVGELDVSSSCGW